MRGWEGVGWLHAQRDKKGGTYLVHFQGHVLELVHAVSHAGQLNLLLCGM